MRKLSERAVIALSLVICLIFLIGALALDAYIHSTGTIKTVNVRADRSLIEWGMMDRGENKTEPITVFNDGNVPLTLTLSHDAPIYVLTDWNIEGYILQPNSNVTGLFWLRIADVTNETAFNFDYTITGVETT